MKTKNLLCIILGVYTISCTETPQKEKDASIDIDTSKLTCPISKCDNLNLDFSIPYVCCNKCCSSANNVEVRACNLKEKKCYTFCSDCLADGYSWCYTAKGELLKLCTSHFDSGI